MVDAIDAVLVEEVGKVVDRARVRTFAGQEDCFQRRNIVIFVQLAVWIFATDGTEGGRCSEHGFYVVLVDDPPEFGSVGRTYRLAFVPLKRCASAALQNVSISFMILTGGATTAATTSRPVGVFLNILLQNKRAWGAICSTYMTLVHP